MPAGSTEPPKGLEGAGLLEWQTVAPALTGAGVLRKTAEQRSTGWIMRLQVDPDPQEQPTVKASDFSPVRFYLCANRACVNDWSNARPPKPCESRQTKTPGELIGAQKIVVVLCACPPDEPATAAPIVLHAW